MHKLDASFTHIRFYVKSYLQRSNPHKHIKLAKFNSLIRKNKQSRIRLRYRKTHSCIHNFTRKQAAMKIYNES